MTWVHNTLRKFTRYAADHPLSYRFTVYIIACSFLFIIFSTALQLTLSYQRESRAIDQQIEVIKTSYLASLTKSLWDVDQAQIDLQLKGIQTLSSVAFLTLISNENNDPIRIPEQAELKAIHRVRKHKFDLIHISPNQTQRSLGELHVDFDLQALYNRIWREGLRILLNQTFLVLLISLAIIVIFRRLISRHLEAMANYSLDIGAGKLDNKLTLSRLAPKRSDELDQLVSALNEMRQAIQKDISRREQQHQQLQDNRDQLKVMVERRTNSLLRAKDEAEEADRTKSQFLSTISHEMRTPMNGMLGMIQVLEDSTLSSLQKKHIHVLHDSTKALLETFNNILEYGRLSESAYSSNVSHFSLTQLLQTVVSISQPLASEKNLSISLEVDSEVANFYYGHENNLRQILTNLLSNALKFTKTGTVTLHVSTSSTNDEEHVLCFEIIDTGIGIAPDLQEQIFERFTQADVTIPHRFGGTGLGLAICKELTQKSNGSIGLESIEGLGTRVWVKLPFSVTTHEQSVDIEPISDIKNQTILLVEDVEINQFVIAGLIGDQHRVRIANDGVEALALSQQEKFDLILMDIHLPKISGLDVIQQIKSDAKCINHTTRIIALTASVQSKDIHTYIRAGFDAVLAKPIDKKLLANAINSPTATRNVPSEVKENHLPQLDLSIIQAHQQVMGGKKLADLMARFCILHDDLWPPLVQSLEQQDDYDCAHIAHKFAGACDILGFALSSSLLRKIEQLAEKNQLSQCASALDELTPVMKETLKIARHWPSAD